MKRWMLLPMLAALAVGCQTQQFATQPLGNVDYDQAYLAARNVFAQYFSIASADPETGKIVARSRSVDSPRPDRLLGTSPARHLAEMRVRREGGEVLVEVRVELQRQGTTAFRQMEPVTVNNELPYRTLSEQTSPYSQEQLDAWQSSGRDEALERKILGDVVLALHPGQVVPTRLTVQPAQSETAPAAPAPEAAPAPTAAPAPATAETTPAKVEPTPAPTPETATSPAVETPAPETMPATESAPAAETPAPAPSPATVPAAPAPGPAPAPATVSAAEVEEYFCGMHPTIAQRQPGMCPVCGMELTKRTTGAPASGPAPATEAPPAAETQPATRAAERSDLQPDE